MLAVGLELKLTVFLTQRGKALEGTAVSESYLHRQFALIHSFPAAGRWDEQRRLGCIGRLDHRKAGGPFSDAENDAALGRVSRVRVARR